MLDVLRQNKAANEHNLEVYRDDLARIEAQRSKSGRSNFTPDQQRQYDDASRSIAETLENLATNLESIAELEEITRRRDISIARAPIPSPAGSGTSEIRGDALRTIENQGRIPDSLRAAAIKVIQSDPTDGVAAYASVAGDPSYLSAWLKLAADPTRGHMLWSGDEHRAMQNMQQMQAQIDAQTRAMSVGTPSAGGYAVPTILDPTFVLTGAGMIDPLRQIATIKTTTANNWHGITAGQITASWDAEASAVSDDSPTLTSPLITPYRGSAFVPLSFEAWDDISNIASEVAKLFADAKTNLEGSTFATGTGSSQPKGISLGVGAVTASRVSPATGGTFALADIYTVQNALPARHSRAASWLASLTILNKIRRFGEGTTGSNSAFWADLGAGIPPELLGRSIHEQSGMSSSTTTGQDILLYGDFSKYYIVDHAGGTRTEFIPNMLDTSTGRPTGQRGLFMWWRTGADVFDVDAFRQLRL